MNDVEQKLFDLMALRSTAVLRQIDQPTRDDIYVISFHIDNNAGAKEIGVELGYNTLSRWHACAPASGQEAHWPIASDKLEAKWNFAFWLQDSYRPVLEGGNVARDLLDEQRLKKVDADEQLRDEWLKSIDCYHDKEGWHSDFEHTLALDIKAEGRFWEMVTELALHLRAEDVIRQTFGRDLPVLIHEVHMDDECIEPTKRANPQGQAESFFVDCYGGV